jgi:hypothetical protein
MIRAVPEDRSEEMAKYSLLAGLAALLVVSPVCAQTSLPIESTPAVLNDPVVQNCRMLAAPRFDPKFPGNASLTRVGREAALLNLDVVEAAVAACRIALAKYPSDPKVPIAHDTASGLPLHPGVGHEFPGIQCRCIDDGAGGDGAR